MAVEEGEAGGRGCSGGCSGGQEGTRVGVFEGWRGFSEKVAQERGRRAGKQRVNSGSCEGETGVKQKTITPSRIFHGENHVCF